MTPLEPVQALGFANFLAQADGVAKVVLVILLVMSLASWYFIVTKTLRLLNVRARSARFLAAFWDAASVQAVATRLEEQHPDEPFSHLAWHGIVSQRHTSRHASRLNEAGSAAEALTRGVSDRRSR